MARKVTFRLSPADRTDLTKKLIEITGDKLREHKKNGTKYIHIAQTIDVPKTRISEIYNKRYMSEKTLARLIRHEFITPEEVLSVELSEEQRKIVQQFIEQV